jgi:hypothetical protein
LPAVYALRIFPEGGGLIAYGIDRVDLFRLATTYVDRILNLGVVEQPCQEYRVPYFACRGNNSQSEQYKAGRRFDKCRASGKKPIVLHLGYHDPNGLDMTRDNTDRLRMFAREPIEVRRKRRHVPRSGQLHESLEVPMIEAKSAVVKRG